MLPSLCFGVDRKTKMKSRKCISKSETRATILVFRSAWKTQTCKRMLKSCFLLSITKFCSAVAGNQTQSDKHPLPSLFLGSIGKTKMAAVTSEWPRHFRLLFCNRCTKFNETSQEVSTKFVLRVDHYQRVFHSQVRYSGARLWQGSITIRRTAIPSILVILSSFAFLCPPLKKEGILLCTCRFVGRSVGRYVGSP